MHSRGRPVFQLDSQIMDMSRHSSIDKVILVARESCGDPQHPLSIMGKGSIHSSMAFTELEHPVATESKVYLAALGRGCSSCRHCKHDRGPWV